jgi:prolyl-tRNA synthetase
MKDAYSFSAGEEDHTKIYEAMKVAYMKVFARLGIGEDTFITFASGGAFTQFSHEFQTICDAGEDVTYINREKGIAINEEVANEATFRELGVDASELTKVATAEVGNIFNFGRQKAEDLGLTFKNEEGKDIPVWMGSYGIGVTRLIGVLVEKFADEKGIVWPENVAPFLIHLIGLNGDDAEIRDYADTLYADLTEAGAEVLYDDRDARTGEKFADADLIGIPYRVVVSRKTKEEGKFEVLTRQSGEVAYYDEDELFSRFGISK